MRIPGPRTRKARVGALVVVLLVAAAGAGAWLLLRDEPAQARSVTEEVSTSTFSETVTASGTLRAKRSEDVAFDVSGTVTKVRVEVGDTVSKGDVLAKVDDENLRAALTAARAETVAARTALSEAVAAGDDVRTAARRSALAAAEADEDDAEEDLEGAVLLAPFVGTVTAVDLTVGDRVGSSGSGASSSGGTSAAPGSTGGSGTSGSSSSSGSIQVATTGRFAVDAQVSATDVEKVEEGLQVELTVSGVDDTVYGTVTEVGTLATTSSSGSAVFDVVVEVTGRRDDLYVGTSADLSIIVRKRSDVLSVSTRAVQRDDDGTYVTVVADGKQERRAVEVGEASGPSTEVTSGLEAGETVLVPGFAGGGREGGRQGGSGELPGGGQMPDFGSGGFPGGMPQPPSGGGR